jgi:hypothetical protein
LAAIFGIVYRFPYIAMSVVPFGIDAANPITRKPIEWAVGTLLALCREGARFYR